MEQHVHVELLHLLDKAQAPDYPFKDIIEWASNARSLNYSFNPTISSYQAVKQDLEEHFNMQSLRPRIIQVNLEAVQQSVPVVSFDFQAMLISLFTDANLMQPCNLVINDAIVKSDGTLDTSPWFLPFKSPDGTIDEVLSALWYQLTVASMDCNNCFVCPLIFYVDKTNIDPVKSRFNLEPLNFTLAIFNRNCRSQYQFWRTLGYIPEIPESYQKNPTAGWKARNYHIMLNTLLQGLQDIHNDPKILDNFYLKIGDDHVQQVNLRIPVAYFIADTQGADKLCGRYVIYRDNINRMHRSCTCRPADATNTTQECEWVEMEEMMEVINRNNKMELEAYSQHYIPNHAFQVIDFGSNIHGIYGATPSDTLHGLKLGVMQHLMQVFVDHLTPMAMRELNKALADTLPFLKQGGNQQFPRLYFPNGITSLANVTAEESVGIVFITYMLSVTCQGRAAILKSPSMSNAILNDYQKGFEMLLVYNLVADRLPDSDDASDVLVDSPLFAKAHNDLFDESSDEQQTVGEQAHKEHEDEEHEDDAMDDLDQKRAAVWYVNCMHYI